DWSSDVCSSDLATYRLQQDELMMSVPFIHLRVHSDFSMVDGMAKVGPINQRATELGYPALALTDQMNLCGLVRFYGDAHRKGLKPLVGTDIWVQNEAYEQHIFRLTLLAMNNVGYQNITRLLSSAYERGHVQHLPVIDQAWLAEYHDGIIVLSGGKDGDLGLSLLKGNTELVASSVAFYQQHFPNRFYLELQRTGRLDEETYLHMAIDLAAEQGLPVVATNEVVFLDKSDFDAHEIRVAIRDGF